jgi:hypothetical protein
MINLPLYHNGLAAHLNTRGGARAQRATMESNTSRHNSATANVETGSKLIEHRGGKTLREDVDKL